MHTCPDCGSIKPEDAQRCECGFAFAPSLRPDEGSPFKLSLLRVPMGRAIYQAGLNAQAFSKGFAERLFEPIVPQRTPLNAALFDLFFVSTHPIRRHLGNLSARKALRVFLVVAAIAACFWLGFSFLR